MVKLNGIKRSKRAVSGLKKSAVVAMAAGLLAFAAVPVQAHGPAPHATGVGVGEAKFTHPVVTIPCTKFTSLTFTVNQVGTYSATDGTGSATYAGPSTLTATTSTAYYEGPGGTYTSSTCSGSPVTIPVSVDVTTPLPGSPVNCPAVTGTYIRDGLTATVTATLTCTVKDNLTAITPSESYTQTTTGVMQPCIVTAPPDSCFFEGTYSAP